MNTPTLPDFTVYIDMVLVIVALFCAWPAYKRGILREGLIAVFYIPYIAILFYILNEFFQDSYSFDSMIFKMSACGGFYLTSLFAIYAVGKIIDNKYKHFIKPELHTLGNISAFGISIFRTFYFVLLCLVLYSLHVDKPEALGKSQFLHKMYPLAQKTQEFLIKKDYINNEIILYQEQFISDKERAGVYVHPIIKKIKNSRKYKEYQDSGMEKKIQDTMLNYINR